MKRRAVSIVVALGARIVSGEPSVAPALLIDGVRHAIEQKRDANRVETQRDWKATAIKFPCAGAIAKAKAANKPLPRLVINGERHDSAYCNFRMDLLIRRQTDALAPVCLAMENFPVDAEGTPAKGLENPDAKVLSGLLFAFEDALRRGVAQERGSRLPEAFGGTQYLIEAMQTPLGQRIWSAKERTLRAEFPRAASTIQLLAKVQKSATWTPRERDRWKQELLAEHPRSIPVLRRFIQQVADDVESRNEGGKLAGETTPKQLPLEIALSLADIENEVRAPVTAKAMTTSKKRFDYFVIGWRDRHLARNLAKLYCDNLESPTPKAQVHAIVGTLHVKGTRELIQEDAASHRIPVENVDGEQLANAWAAVVGSANAENVYPDQPLRAESFAGKPFILTKQIGGARIVVVLKKLDPLEGTSLSTPGTLMHFGPPGSLQKHLGLDPTKPVPAVDKMNLATAMLNEYTASLKRK